MKDKKFLANIIFFLFCTFVSLTGVCYGAAEKKEGIDSFPESYQPYLLELQKKHPTWSFTALYTNIDWTYVINQENQFGKNLVPKSYSDRWKNTKKGEYNVEVDAGWVDSSRRAVEFAMDPRNFLNEGRIFQFEGLSYNAKTNTLQGIEKILYGTEFYNKIVQYKTATGNTITMDKKYSDLILSAAKTSKVSAYHLASRIKQEVGPFLSHGSISGTVKGYEGLYNFYNIGATSSSADMGAIKNGLQYAKDGHGADNATKTKYLIPWNNKEKAITGGGIFIGSSYIHQGQDTIYLQKFHVVGEGELFWHQYMTNVLAPYSEASIIHSGYVKSNILDNPISFIIPVYDNMQDSPVENPNILENDFTKDNTKVYANVDSSLNIRVGPSTSYESLTLVGKNETMTRIAKGRQAGELWDKVKLSSGMVGYVFHTYLKEVPNRQIEQIKLSMESDTIAKGETKKLTVEILPEEAKNHAVTFTSSNPKIATVDSRGNILALKSGETTITVKAKENNVSSKMTIYVYSKVTDLELNKTHIVVQVGDSFTIKPTIIPEDASNKNVSYEIESEDLLEHQGEGNIMALAEGTTKVIVKTEDGGLTKEAEVIVVPKLEEGYIQFDESLAVKQNEVSGWSMEDLTARQVREKVTTNGVIEIYDAKGNLLEDDKKIGTGSKIKVTDESGNLKMEYDIIIYGDLNGDGKIDSIDLYMLQRHILEMEVLKGVFTTAGNIRKDGKAPSSIDSLIIQRHILEIEFIQQ